MTTVAADLQRQPAIAVATMSFNTTTTTTGIQPSQSLDSLYAYLLRHGALEPDEVKQFRQNGSNEDRQINEVLRRAAQVDSPTRELFVNGLRVVGKFHHANSIDESPRIPAAISASQSPFFSSLAPTPGDMQSSPSLRKRHKGQLRLKLTPLIGAQIAQHLAADDQPSQAPVSSTSGQPKQSTDGVNKSSGETVSAAQSSWFASLFLCCCWRSSKGATWEDSGDRVTNKPTDCQSHSNGHVIKGNRAAPLHESDSGYAIQNYQEQTKEIVEQLLRSRDQLTKYFEQKKRSLMLDMKSKAVSSVLVDLILVNLTDLENLWQDLTYGVVSLDVERILIGRNAVQLDESWRIRVSFRETEYRMALAELQASQRTPKTSRQNSATVERRQNSSQLHPDNILPNPAQSDSDSSQRQMSGHCKTTAV